MEIRQRTNLQLYGVILGQTRNNNFRVLRDLLNKSFNRAAGLWKNKCGINMRFYNYGSATCYDHNPCITKLNINGNREMNIYNDAWFTHRDYLNHPTVVIFVAPHAKFEEGSDYFGTTLRFGRASDYGVFIWLTLGAITGGNPYLLAHEIGHALFIRNYSENRYSHSTNTKNLMYPDVPISNPQITQGQCRLAKLSNLLY